MKILIILIILLSLPSFASSIQYISTNDGSWNDPSIWVSNNAEFVFSPERITENDTIIINNSIEGNVDLTFVNSVIIIGEEGELLSNYGLILENSFILNSGRIETNHLILTSGSWFNGLEKSTSIFNQRIRVSSASTLDIDKGKLSLLSGNIEIEKKAELTINPYSSITLDFGNVLVNGTYFELSESENLYQQSFLAKE